LKGLQFLNVMTFSQCLLNLEVLGRYLSLEGTPVPERHDVKPVPGTFDGCRTKAMTAKEDESEVHHSEMEEDSDDDETST
jgi:hypothetical protein